MKTLEKIKDVTIRKPYIYSFFIIILIYIAITIIINKFYTVFSYLISFNPKFVIPSLILNLIVAVLIAINVNLVYSKFREIRKIKSTPALTFFGAFSGMLGGLCPGCVTGLFPLIASIFGISLGLASLPFKGLEFQALAILLLVISISFLTKEGTCKIRRR